MSTPRDYADISSRPIRSALRKIPVSRDSVLYGEKGEEFFVDICLEAKRALEQEKSSARKVRSVPDDSPREGQGKGCSPRIISLLGLGTGGLIGGTTLAQVTKAAAVISAVVVGQQFLDEKAPLKEEPNTCIAKLDSDGNEEAHGLGANSRQGTINRLDLDSPSFEFHFNENIKFVFRGDRLVWQEYELLDSKLMPNPFEENNRADLILLGQTGQEDFVVSDFIADSASTHPVRFIPEPSSLGVVLIGIAVSCLRCRRRN